MKGKKLNLMGRVLMGVGAIVGSADAGEMEVYNYSDDLINASVVIKNIAEANEGFDESYDFHYNGGNPNKLHAYVLNNNSDPNTLSLDSRGFWSISGFDVALKANEFIASANNKLVIHMLDNSGYENRNIIAYNTKSPEIIYPVDKTNGAMTWIDLPDLVNQPAGVYDIWRVTPERKLAGDISGPSSSDGKVDICDLATLTEEWLCRSNPGENYFVSDTNLDRVTNLKDFVSIADTWLMDDSAPASASESTMDALTGSYKEALVNEHDKKPKKSK